ncbi:MAG TPA: NFACT RNA binding domain-containing protein [candidate division Zixibacteria bacterium]|nr:NFACT RNA binding domain-containing protein [candidate division Zixibacteria bacterium]
MQTSLHILNLVAELKREVLGAEVVATEFYKKERAAYLVLKKDKIRLALGFVYHPAGHGTFLIPASKIAIETREKPWPVFDIAGGHIAEIHQFGLDRVFELTIVKGDTTGYVIYEALGPNGNLWLLNTERRRTATLRKRQYDPNEEYAPMPLPANRIDPRKFDRAAFEQLVNANHDQRPTTVLEKNLLGFNRTLAREAVARADLDSTVFNEISESEGERLIGAVSWLTGQFAQIGAGYLYDIAGGFQAYPFKLKSSEEQPRKFKSLSLAVQQIVISRRSGVEADDEEKCIRDAVKRALKRVERKLANIKHDIDEAEDFETYRRTAELLQIHFNLLKKGMTSVVVVDVYTDPTVKIEVALDPAQTPQDNIESYVRRYRKGRDGYDLLKRRLEITAQEIDRLRCLSEALDTNFGSAVKQYDEELQSLLPREAGRRESQPRLPYREYSLSSGLIIFVGRDGADNDRTTFDFAKPYELWFHTQQCPGSHVVMKFPNKSFEPSKAEITETAAIAAFHSKARRDSLVPVIYTQRRYVRKPRKAKPGLVTVEREKSIMVAPTPPKA